MNTMPLFPAAGSPTLLLHVGNHKTGTTALQRWLFSSPACLDAHGILYPRSACEHWQHRPLAQAALRDDWATVGGLLDAIAQEAGERHLILSSEWVQFLSEAQTRGLHDAIAATFPHHDKRCLLYIRRQDEFFDSFYNQEVKYGFFADDFSAFFARYGRMGDYEGQASLWTSLVGPQRLSIRLYDRTAMPGGDTIADFCAVAGFDEEPRPSQRDDNRALPTNLFVFKRLMNRYINMQSDEYLRALAGILSDVARDVPHSVVVATTRMERAFVMGQFASGNRRLFDRHFGGVDAFRSHQDSMPPFPATVELSRETLASLFVHVTQYFEHTMRNSCPR